MEDIFGWLTDEEWLAVLRIGLGLWWLESVRHKDIRGFLRGGAMDWVQSLTEDHPVPAFAKMVQRVSLSTHRRRIATSWLVVLGELGAGLSITFGLITYAGLAVGLFLNFNYLVLAGPKDQGEQGQNLMMLLIGVALFATAAGMTWGVDAKLF